LLKAFSTRRALPEFYFLFCFVSFVIMSNGGDPTSSMPNTLIILRGLPGSGAAVLLHKLQQIFINFLFFFVVSGKSSLAKAIQDYVYPRECHIFSQDEYVNALWFLEI